jgi:hypothetical protein
MPQNRRKLRAQRQVDSSGAIYAQVGLDVGNIVLKETIEIGAAVVEIGEVE